jgi:hypothetical protein
VSAAVKGSESGVGSEEWRSESDGDSVTGSEESNSFEDAASELDKTGINMSESRMWKEGGSEDGEGSEASVSGSIVGTTKIQSGSIW